MLTERSWEWLRVATMLAALAPPMQASDPGVHVLQSIMPDTGSDDLTALEPLLSSARLVGVGEATHGTSEFSTMRWRLMEYLAERHDFRLFLMEGDLIAVQAYDDFVVRGEGNPRDILVKYSEGWPQAWSGSVQERVDLLLWAREFNRLHEEPIRFLGIGSVRLARSMDATVRAVEALRPDLAREIERRYSGFRELDREHIARRPASAALSFRPPEGPGVVKASAWIRTSEVERGWAGLSFRVERSDGERELISMDSWDVDAPGGTTPWKQYSISYRAPANTKKVGVNAYTVATGTTWFDDLRVTFGGEPLTPEKGDPTFDTLEDLWTYNPSHEVALGQPRPDSEGSSLRFRYQPSELDEALAEAQSVVDELGALEVRPDLRDEKTWAVQYARMVVQGLVFRDMAPARDRSLAENVRWWLDQFPGAMGIISAHNSHIARRGSGYGSLGDHLSEWYGEEYRPLGMTTHSGTYLAEGEEDAGIFFLPEPPSDSAEAVLHSLDIPILAVDLREVDPESTTGPLVREPIKMRTVGVGHKEDHFHNTAADLPAWFDGLIFIDTTSHTSLLPQAREQARGGETSWRE